MIKEICSDSGYEGQFTVVECHSLEEIKTVLNRYSMVRKKYGDHVERHFFEPLSISSDNGRIVILLKRTGKIRE